MVCPVCTERREDGSCGLERIDECPIETHLESLVYVAVTVDSPRIDDYLDAIRESACATCRHREQPSERCEIRAEGHCALDAYLIPALEVVDEFVAEIEGRARPLPAARR